MTKSLSLVLGVLLIIASLATFSTVTSQNVEDQLFIWPIDCTLNDTCTSLGLPDPDGDGIAYNGSRAGYEGHEGTDIGISRIQMDLGVNVYAAADGIVEFVFDGKYDRCPSAHEDCKVPEETSPGQSEGTTVCTELGPYCGTGEGSCYWCFAGGNVIVIKHSEQNSYFATRYDHLKKNSIIVNPGDHVKQGDVIAKVGSAGKSTGPHLHFEVWGSAYYHIVDPWALGLWADSPVDRYARETEEFNISQALFFGFLIVLTIFIIYKITKRWKK